MLASSQNSKEATVGRVNRKCQELGAAGCSGALQYFKDIELLSRFEKPLRRSEHGTDMI
jgi:hypothetical protein